LSDAGVDASVPEPAGPPAGASTLAGLFLVTLATLAFQVLLTRIFSVTMWYHFAFLAVSLAMLGMTAGAILVFLAPGRFPQARVQRRMAQSALVFAGAIVASLLVHLALPVRTDGSWGATASLAATCAVFFAPFTASGVCVCLALTRFPSRVGSLYAADLVGAAVGCLSVVALLSQTDGPTAVVAVASLAALGAAAFARADRAAGLRRGALGAAAGLLVFALASGGLAGEGGGLLRVRWQKSHTGLAVESPPPLLERWNSHSRIRVWGDPVAPRAPFGWSFSPALPAGYALPQLDLDIDASAYTVLTRFDGSLAPLRFLEYDVTNLAHHLRSDADVLVIGAGGGRDVLSALVFGQASVLGVEVNADILDVVHGVYGDFTGHLDRHPRVRFVSDEARSFVARLEDRFDVIQISLIDSWAATGAGAFVLTEHSLYTVEAWRSFLEHLKPGGILTVTRFYFPENPATAYRLVGLAVRALEAQGVAEPREHIALAWLPARPGSMCTLLVSADPLTAHDLDRLEALVARLGFEIVLSPRRAANEVFARVAAGGDLSGFYAGFPLDISPPVDDRPFFFHMLRLRDILAGREGRHHGLAEFNRRAVSTLGTLLASVALLTLACVIVPVALRSELGAARAAAPWLLVFAGIGIGFMMVEISQMERLIVFLGHPTYALTVVLFVLLLASGLGSLATGRVGGERLARAGRSRFAALLVALALFGAATPAVTAALRAGETPVRVLASVALLLPIGFLMGMPFPLGLRAASAAGPRGAELTPWLWGVNGAAGVLASVLAIAVALSFGISVSYWCGVGAYAVAGLGWLWATRARPG
jgi:spermidine synthase